MGELGDAAVDEHSALAGYLADHGVDRLVAVGDSANVRALADAAESMGLNTVRAPETGGAAEAVAAEIRPGDVALVKASYADGLWRVADALVPVAQQNSTERRGK